MPEPVVSTGSALAALAAGHRGRILLSAGESDFEAHSKQGGQSAGITLNTATGDALSFEALLFETEFDESLFRSGHGQRY